MFIKIHISIAYFISMFAVATYASCNKIIKLWHLQVGAKLELQPLYDK